MAVTKTEYKKEFIVPCKKHGLSCASTKTLTVQKTYLCDMAKANACQRRARWYGIETIGPRVYTLYTCPEHGRFRVRLN